MSNFEVKLMRDVLIGEIYKKMHENTNIYFLSDDFGAIALDKLRSDFKDRFINVGIAEQNLINISTGLALENFIVYAYGIAPFVTMRCYEQIRNNLSLLSHLRELNVNLIGVGAGMSYDVSGPTHHCFEDISIMRLLPGITVFSPSDWIILQKFVDYSIEVKKPKYIRLDGKPLPQIYNNQNICIEDGFCELIKGKEICLVSTGFMTHTALKAASKLIKRNISVGVIDIFILKPLNYDLLFDKLKRYKYIISVEEGFINKGGLDCLISDLLLSKHSHIELKKIGLGDKYIFVAGDRNFLHELNGLDEKSIIKTIQRINKKTIKKS